MVFLTNVKVVGAFINLVMETIWGQGDICGILGPEFDDRSRLSLHRLDESFGHHLPQDYRSSDSLPSSNFKLGVSGGGPLGLYACEFDVLELLNYGSNGKTDETRTC